MGIILNKTNKKHTYFKNAKFWRFLEQQLLEQLQMPK